MSNSDALHSIHRLPADCLTEVFTFLDHRTIFQTVSPSCRDWNDLLNDPANHDFWIGRLCARLHLPNAGEECDWVAKAVGENGDQRVSPTYFLLTHYMEKILRGRRAVELAAGKTQDGVNTSRRIVDVNRAVFTTAGCDFLFHGRIIADKSELESIKSRLISANGAVNMNFLHLPQYTKHLEDNKPLVVLGNYHHSGGQILSPQFSVSYARKDALEVFRAQENTQAVMHSFLFVDGSPSYFGSSYKEDGNIRRTLGWVSPSTLPWAQLSPHGKQRVALAAIFNIMMEQGLLDGVRRVQTEWAQSGTLSLKTLLSCVLDYIALRCLLHFNATTNDTAE